MKRINACGLAIDPHNDIQFDEANEIIENSTTEMELVGNGYIYGYLQGRKDLHKTADIPISNIPMMSDERWQELTRENAVHNYTKQFGHAPESTEQAVCWQRAWIKSILEECEDLPEQKARAAS